MSVLQVTSWPPKSPQSEEMPKSCDCAALEPCAARKRDAATSQVHVLWAPNGVQARRQQGGSAPPRHFACRQQQSPACHRQQSDQQARKEAQRFQAPTTRPCVAAPPPPVRSPRTRPPPYQEVTASCSASPVQGADLRVGEMGVAATLSRAPNTIHPRAALAADGLPLGCRAVAASSAPGRPPCDRQLHASRSRAASENQWTRLPVSPGEEARSRPVVAGTELRSWEVQRQAHRAARKVRRPGRLGALAEAQSAAAGTLLPQQGVEPPAKLGGPTIQAAEGALPTPSCL